MPKTAAVIDTNVFISTLLKSAPALNLIDLIAEDTVVPVLSQALFDEFNATIAKPKFQRSFDPAMLAFLHLLIKERALFVKPREPILACRDVKDNLLLECAVGFAGFIVTGDKDLLVLNPFRGVKIVTAGEFLKRFRG